LLFTVRKSVRFWALKFYLREMKKTLLLLILSLGLTSWSSAQIRLMGYNMLNFPTGNLQGRVDTLQNIVSFTRPHLLMIQELKTAEGLAEVTDMMDDIGYGNFASSTFLPQQSAPGSSNPLQQAIVYDLNVFRMKSESYVLTDVRDINEFVLYLNDPALGQGADTTFLYVYVTHLKSSEGAVNVQARLDMVNNLVAHFENIPADANVIFAGDFNLYTNTEPCFIAALNPGNAIVLKDPFESYGDWAGSSFAHKEILTQCTRVAQFMSDGASGGIDDRFDFILFSESLMNQSANLHYTEDSFKSLGNTGGCYNQNITDCITGNDVPLDVLQSMYYMSDHIPQICQMTTLLEIPEYVAENAALPFQLKLVQNTDGQFGLRYSSNESFQSEILLWTFDGKLMLTEPVVISSGTHDVKISSNQNLAPGIYLTGLAARDGSYFTQRFIIQE
jgi:hypothetical protein